MPELGTSKNNKEPELSNLDVANQVLRSLIKSIPLVGTGLEELTYGSFNLKQRNKLESEARVFYSEVRDKLSQLSDSHGYDLLINLEIIRLLRINAVQFAQLLDILTPSLIRQQTENEQREIEDKHLATNIKSFLKNWTKVIVNEISTSINSNLFAEGLLQDDLQAGIGSDDFLSYCREFVADSEYDPTINQWFVEPDWTQPNIDDPIYKKFKDKYTSELNLTEYLAEWLKTTDSSLLILLGDYGTGKTTFSKRIARMLALGTELVAGKNYLPLFIRLRRYTNSSSVATLLKDHLKNMGIPFNFFRTKVRSGEILLFLDGFDEMSALLRKNLDLLQLSDITNTLGPNFKIILTSRTHFFRDRESEASSISIILRNLHDEVDRLVPPSKYTPTIHLENFSDEKTKEYARNRLGNQCESFNDRISNIPDLPDLVRRPILSDLLCSEWAHFSEQKNINILTIYNDVTSRWLSREEWRSLTKEDVNSFMELLSIEMFKKEKQSIHYSELESKITETFKNHKYPEKTFQEIDTHIRTSSFLNRDPNGYYEFMHRSFWEYYVSKVISNWIIENSLTLLLFRHKSFTDLMAQFITVILGFEYLWNLIEKHQPVNNVQSLNFCSNLIFILSRADKLPGKEKITKMSFWSDLIGDLNHTNITTLTNLFYVKHGGHNCY